MTKSKDEKKPPPQDEPDFEKLYYQAMKENMLLRDDKIALTFTAEEINLLRSVMFEELLDVRDRWSFLYDRDDDGEDKKALNKNDDDAVSKQLITEKRLAIESIIKKLRFEI